MGPKNDIKVIGNKGKFISLSPPSVKVSMVACHKAWRNRRSGRVISFSSLRLPVIFLLSKGFDPRLCSVSFCEALPIPLCMVATSGFPCRSNHHSIHLPPMPLSEEDSSSATVHPTHTIFPAIQDFCLV